MKRIAALAIGLFAFSALFASSPSSLSCCGEASPCCEAFFNCQNTPATFVFKTGKISPDLFEVSLPSQVPELSRPAWCGFAISGELRTPPPEPNLFIHSRAPPSPPSL